MELVADTNCIIAALIKSAKSREIICSPKIKLYAPEHIVSEVLHHKQEIIKKSDITETDMNELINEIWANVTIIPETEYKRYKDQAKRLAQHEEDAPFLALAPTKNIPIWSNDSDMKQQSMVKVYTTPELAEELKK